jgi:hypothetical protein
MTLPWLYPRWCFYVLTSERGQTASRKSRSRCGCSVGARLAIVEISDPVTETQHIGLHLRNS